MVSFVEFTFTHSNEETFKELSHTENFVNRKLISSRNIQRN